MVGRWATISFLDSRRGDRTVEWLRDRMVLPGSRKKGERGIPGGPTDAGDEWDEEAPLPDVPAPHA